MEGSSRTVAMGQLRPEGLQILKKYFFYLNTIASQFSRPFSKVLWR